MIDFLIVRQRDFRDLRLTGAMTGAECWADHRQVRSTMNHYLPPPHRNRPKTARASYNTRKLKNPSHLEEYRRLLREKFADGSIRSGVSFEKWYTFENVIAAVAKEVHRT